MKKTDKEIEELSTRALNSLDAVEQAEANPFLFAKVKHRLITKRREAAAKQIRLMLRLSAVLLLFVGINAGSYFVMQKWQPPPAPASKPQKPLTGAAAVNQAYFGADNNNTYSY